MGTRDHRDDLPRIHERVHTVQKAESEIRLAVLDVEEKYDLTFGELVAILSSVLSTSAKYEIRVERHGDASKPGGLASSPEDPEDDEDEEEE